MFNLISVVFLVSRLSGTNISFQPTMLNVVTTMLGLVICSRAAESFAAYARAVSCDGAQSTDVQSSGIKKVEKCGLILLQLQEISRRRCVFLISRDFGAVA